MISLTGSLRVFVCTQPADMRRSFDGLCGMARDLLKQDPLTGHLFLFRNRNRDQLKVLYWDRDGLHRRELLESERQQTFVIQHNLIVSTVLFFNLLLRFIYRKRREEKPCED